MVSGDRSSAHQTQYSEKRSLSDFTCLKIWLSTAVAVALLPQVAACVEKTADASDQQVRGKAIRMNEPKLTTRYDALGVTETPSVIPASVEQSLYVASLVRSVIEVLLQKTSLENAEQTLFGEGQYFWPKAPQKPVRTSKSYDQNNFRVNFISLSFARTNENSVWSGAALSVTPKAFPRSAYQFAIPPNLFAGMILERTYAEERPANGSAPARRVHIFEFSLNDGGVTLSLQFETRADLSNLKALHPVTFDLLKVKRAGG